MKLRNIIVLLLMVPALLWAGGNQESKKDDSSMVVDGKVKYVFLFIGDGMAMPQITSAEAFIKAVDKSGIGINKLALSQLEAQGMATTHASSAFITDSAAAGTAMATGNKTESGVISMDPTKQVSYPTLAELAKEAGMKVGIVSSVNLDHATPACFYAHNASRNNYYEINMELAKSNFDYFAGGQVRIDKTPSGEKTAEELMKAQDVVIVTTKDGLMALKPGDKKVYAYNHGFAANALDYALDMKKESISLAEFTKKGIELLDNEKGFFMMVEGGKIDWACHANDAAASIYDTIAFDSAVKEAIEFYNAHPDETLIVVTGDHETGGLSLGFAGTQYDSAFDIIAAQQVSFEAFDTYVLKEFKKNNPRGTLEDLMPAIVKNFGLTNPTEYEYARLQEAFAQSMLASSERDSSDEAYLLYGGYEPLSVTITHLVNQRAGLAWTSYSHTGVPVPVFASGVGAALFNGYYDNTDIFHKIMKVMALNTKVAMAE